MYNLYIILDLRFIKLYCKFQSIAIKFQIFAAGQDVMPIKPGYYKYICI